VGEAQLLKMSEHPQEARSSQEILGWFRETTFNCRC